ncbi:hypothetical protein N8I74_01395 [Chitiniphilus purpureus]|uniref:HD-GYP domain-containing protein n=1 Tax=Chitiniphilus purpureus TaxID=2981137 RepID=A0ABY6DRI6_9NEIS|nr:HD domain-containing phosphohydrolase [Chitiniphilus sp. CD1]UXY15696.1 hypothetical protein N8I74_01395 [Chitiniphilus sp. CD1]
MASYSRVRCTDVQLGQALPWDVFDGKGLLLLSRGQRVGSEAQLARLLEIGVYADSEALARTRNAPQRERLIPGSARPPSVLAMLDAAQQRLEQLLQNPTPWIQARRLEAEVMQLAALVENASRCDPNVALARVLLRQDGRYPARHMVNVAVVARLAAVSMALPPETVRAVVCAALTMNVTMASLQDTLQQQRGPLSPAQRQGLQRHPEEAHALLQRAGVTDPVWLGAVLQHHERSDGSGYPAGLCGEAISPAAHLLALADLFCAQVTPSAYRQTALPNVVLRSILLARGKDVDLLAAGYFIKTLGVYPPGQLVRLANGEVGVVAKHGSKASCPLVASLIGPRGAPLSLVLRRDTAEALYAIREAVDADRFGAFIRPEAVWGDTARSIDA